MAGFGVAIRSTSGTVGYTVAWRLLTRCKPTAIRITSKKINYHPQSGWFEDAPLQGGAVRAIGAKLRGSESQWVAKNRLLDSRFRGNDVPFVMLA
jgi:hypothetical protein